MTFGDWHHYDYIIRAIRNPDGSMTLDEMRQGRAYVAEVNLPDLAGSEVTDHLFGIFTGQFFAAF